MVRNDDDSSGGILITIGACIIDLEHVDSSPIKVALGLTTVTTGINSSNVSVAHARD